MLWLLLLLCLFSVGIMVADESSQPTCRFAKVEAKGTVSYGCVTESGRKLKIVMAYDQGHPDVTIIVKKRGAKVTWLKEAPNTDKAGCHPAKVIWKDAALHNTDIPLLSNFGDLIAKSQLAIGCVEIKDDTLLVVMTIKNGMAKTSLAIPAPWQSGHIISLEDTGETVVYAQATHRFRWFAWFRKSSPAQTATAEPLPSKGEATQ